MYLRTLVNLASLRPGGPLTLNRGYTAFSSVRTPKDLPPWNIWYDGDLVPTDSHEARLAASIAQGSSQNPTLRDLHQQLNSQREFLRGRTEHRSRAVTDAIIEHTRVMLLDRCPMGLILEDRLPEVTVAPLNKHAEVRTLTGSADYLCTIPPIPDNTKTAADYNSEDFEALFPIEAKTRNIHLRFPHLVLEMYARALHRPSTRVIRGAITTGYEWMFVILYIDEDRRGGRFQKSGIMRIDCDDTFPYHTKDCKSDIISRILAYWAMNCFKGIGPDDWLTVGTGEDYMPKPRRKPRSKHVNQKEDGMVGGVVDS